MTQAIAKTIIVDGKRRSTRTYKSWLSAIQRCHNPNDSNYPHYGAKGIIVCDEWRNSFHAFANYMGERPAGKTLDRWPDRRGNYAPGNCRWATVREQLLNREFGYQIEVNGVKMNLREIADHLGVSYDQARSAFHEGRIEFASGISIRDKEIKRAFGPVKSALTDEQIVEIRSLRGAVPARVLAERFGLSREHIGRIQRGLRLASRGTSGEPCPEVVD